MFQVVGNTNPICLTTGSWRSGLTIRVARFKVHGRMVASETFGELADRNEATVLYMLEHLAACRFKMVAEADAMPFQGCV